jgi:hypothetical protein
VEEGPPEPPHARRPGREGEERRREAVGGGSAELALGRSNLRRRWVSGAGLGARTFFLDPSATRCLDIYVLKKLKHLIF